MSETSMVGRKAPKLTPAQRAILEDARDASIHVEPEYKPAKKLVELGLAVIKPARFGGSLMELTEEGRAVLSPEAKTGEGHG